MSASHRPNILFIICHDVGQHLGCYGAGLATPKLDELAADGVRFTKYACTAAQCSPSRGSIMTGRYPHNNGLVGLAHIGWELHDDEVTIPMHLNDDGYDTYLFGGQHESAEPERLGYQNIRGESGNALGIAPRVAEFLRERGEAGAEQPFFACVGIAEPHRPYQREGYNADDPAHVTLLPWLPDRPGIREDIAGLNGLMYAVDEAVGIMTDALTHSGLEESTLVVFTTDHGLAMPRAKGMCYDPGIMTALIMRLPGRFDGGRTHDDLLGNVDMLPTLLDLVGTPASERVEGRSFLGLLDGADYAPREDVFVEMTWHDKYNPMRGIRTTRHKYVRNFGDRPLVYLPSDIYRGRAGEEMRDEYYATSRPEEELYDLASDPLEYNNLAGDTEHDEVLGTLRDRVQQWMQETGDPLVQGDWPPTEKQRQRLETDTTPN
ncbi:MAG: sulfatase [Armatimonadota bacterium]